MNRQNLMTKKDEENVPKTSWMLRQWKFRVCMRILTTVRICVATDSKKIRTNENCTKTFPDMDAPSQYLSYIYSIEICLVRFVIISYIGIYVVQYLHKHDDVCVIPFNDYIRPNRNRFVGCSTDY